MLLSSILITSDDGDPALPPLILENIASLKAHHPGLPHRLFREDDVVALLEDKFPREVRDSYFALRPYSYRADLARYCILHEFGGLYADLSYFLVQPIPIADDRPVVFRGNLVSAPWDTSVGLVFAPPKHKAIERAIELVCANVKRRYYGSTPLCPTSTALFGKALAETCEAEEIETGWAKLLARQRAEQRAPRVPLPDSPMIHCQFLHKTLVAVKRKRPVAPGLIELGVSTGNIYREMWKSREVYS